MTHSSLTSKVLMTCLMVLALSLAGSGWAMGHRGAKDQASERGAKPEQAAQMRGTEGNAVDWATQNDQYSTFVRALRATNLVDTLRGQGPYTVFVPTNDAFDKLPKENLDKLFQPENRAELTKILRYHVVRGNLSSAEIQKMNSIKSLEGSPVKISTKGDNIMLNTEAKITRPDIAVSNGVVHVVDRVLGPPDIAQRGLNPTPAERSQYDHRGTKGTLHKSEAPSSDYGK